MFYTNSAHLRSVRSPTPHQGPVRPRPPPHLRVTEEEDGRLVLSPRAPQHLAQVLAPLHLGVALADLNLGECTQCDTMWEV